MHSCGMYMSRLVSFLFVILSIVTGCVLFRLQFLRFRLMIFSLGHHFQVVVKRKTPERFRGHFLNLNQNQTCEKFFLDDWCIANLCAM
jgi:hypothetical protein